MDCLIRLFRKAVGLAISIQFVRCGQSYRYMASITRKTGCDSSFGLSEVDISVLRSQIEVRAAAIDGSADIPLHSNAAQAGLVLGRARRRGSQLNVKVGVNSTESCTHFQIRFRCSR